MSDRLPIGGVLATENTVIPYAVGVDIACRMKMTVFDRKVNTIAGKRIVWQTSSKARPVSESACASSSAASMMYG